MLKRMWINQPSSLQPLHQFHGENVLYDKKNGTIYFTKGLVISLQIPTKLSVLDNGWIFNEKVLEF